MSGNQQKGKEPLVGKKKKQRPVHLSPITSPSPVTRPAMMPGVSSPPHLHPSQSAPSAYHGFTVPPLFFPPNPSNQPLMPVAQFTPPDSGASFPSSHQSHEPRSSPVTHEESISHDDVSKGILYIVGNGFVPSRVAATAITGLIKGQYHDGWPSWKKIPREVVDVWFKEFTGQFLFVPLDKLKARKVFEFRGATILKNNLNKIHIEGKQPVWMGDAAWESLLQHWRSDAFKKKSEIAKKNRASDCGGLGGSLHTCGSITSSQHRANLTKSTGVVPSPAELFRHTHTRKKDNSWVDRRSEAIYENYNRSMEEMTQRASDEGTSLPNELTVWQDIAGVKKGRIYV